MIQQLYSEQEEELEGEITDPKKSLQDLKMLYDHNKIAFDERDEMRVLTALYLQEKPVIRMYREVLFQKMTKRAL